MTAYKRSFLFLFEPEQQTALAALFSVPLLGFEEPCLSYGSIKEIECVVRSGPVVFYPAEGDAVRGHF